MRPHRQPLTVSPGFLVNFIGTALLLANCSSSAGPGKGGAAGASARGGNGATVGTGGGTGAGGATTSDGGGKGGTVGTGGATSAGGATTSDSGSRGGTVGTGGATGVGGTTVAPVEPGGKADAAAGSSLGGAGGGKSTANDAAAADAGRPAQDASGPAFRAIMWSVKDPWHFFMNDARTYIQQLGKEYNFQADFSEDLGKHTESFLSQYQLYINLNIEVTPLSEPQKRAFEGFINAGKGWVGFHMAGNNKQNWPWYDAFLGGCRFTGHPEIQRATLNVEDVTHPASKNLPSPKWQLTDEFYEFDRSPRPNVRVLASLDEKTYKPARPIGDHPYIWCNEKYPKTIYIGLGHPPTLWTENPDFRKLVRDAILWAGGIVDKAPVVAPKPAGP